MKGLFLAVAAAAALAFWTFNARADLDRGMSSALVASDAGTAGCQQPTQD